MARYNQKSMVEQINSFWSRVYKNHPSGCWVWLGARMDRTHRGGGYGMVWVGKKKYLTHRLSYELVFGSIPEGLRVLHTCDNPICVNPAHLFAGTQLDNVHDAIHKGRANGVPLSDEDVINIRKRYICGETVKSISEDYGSSYTYLHQIIRYDKRRQ